MKTILYLTDLYYEAKGRRYCDEDLYVTSILKNHFHVLIGHPTQALEFLDAADVVVFRNTGPVIYHQDYFSHFFKKVNEDNIITFNSFDGHADMKGKQYLIDLSRQNYPVIPTVSSVQELDKLGACEKYIIKIKNGADSIGMKIMLKDELLTVRPTDHLIQPLLDFKYEVSFYYLNNQFQYAFYAPDKQKRWELVEYIPTSEDLVFADTFIRWNNMVRGISRVDACRLDDGGLWLVELEDLNPFLSLDLLSKEKRDVFINSFVDALKSIPVNKLSLS